MKHLLLTLGIGAFATSSFGQAVVSVEAPASIAGLVTFTHSGSANPAWAADINDPANLVVDTLVLVDDGTAADSLGCNNLTNGAALAGNIALVYRGSCAFSMKALKAQQAGAIAVVIINNAAGDPIIPGGTAPESDDVTIPVVMVSDAQGAIFRQKMALGEKVRVLIGNKIGHYDNDMAVAMTDVLRAPMYSVPSELLLAGSDMPIDLAATVRNYGTSAQTGVTVTVKVHRGATELFTNTSSAFSVDAYGGTQDSMAVAFPTFTPASYLAGDYTITYTVNTTSTEKFPSDNVLVTKFNVNGSGAMSIGAVNGTFEPVSSSHSMPSPFTTSFSECFHFSHPHASRLEVRGITFTAAVNSPNTLEGLQVIPTVYKWNDLFADVEEITQTMLDAPNLEIVAQNMDFYITGTPANGSALYAPFTTYAPLEDDERYLVCVQSYSDKMFLGYTTTVNYNQNFEHYKQPIQAIENNGKLNVAGFTGRPVPTLVLKTHSNTVSLNENTVETSSYPNPTKDVVTVKVNAAGNAKLIITDLAGRMVASENVVISEGKFKTNVSEMTSGTYVFNLTYENGTASQFKVVVAK